MSEGFFLGLQDDYDLEEVRRSKAAAEIKRIVPRAA
jgi:plasmid maintenance system antidote protein VapI